MIRYLDISSAPFAFEQVNIAVGSAAPEIEPFYAVARRITNDMPVKQIIGKFRVSATDEQRIIIRPAAAVDDAQHAADQTDAMRHQIKAEPVAAQMGDDRR